jgi:acetyltransferase-like isoleucine patch superfamily enzyme
LSRSHSSASFLHRLVDLLGALQPALHLRLVVAQIVCGVLPQFWSGTIRARIYRAIGFNVGARVSVLGNICLTSGLTGIYAKLTLGDDSLVSTNVTINLDDQVTIGRNVTVGPYVLIYTGTHRMGPASQRCLPGVVGRPVRIEEGCWIRVGAVILPGVTVGHGSVVGAGAVVSHDVPPNSYVEGNPARIVRELSTDYAPERSAATHPPLLRAGVLANRCAQTAFERCPSFAAPGQNRQWDA